MGNLLLLEREMVCEGEERSEITSGYWASWIFDNILIYMWL